MPAQKILCQHSVRVLKGPPHCFPIDDGSSRLRGAVRAVSPTAEYHDATETNDVNG